MAEYGLHRVSQALRLALSKIIGNPARDVVMHGGKPVFEMHDSTHDFSTNPLREKGPPEDTDAKDIYQCMLDTITGHFWKREWGALESCFAIPNHVSAPDASRVFHCVPDLINMLRAGRDNFERAGATEYHRLCLKAQFDDETRTRISGQHVTYILRGANPVVPPYHGNLRAILQDGRWLAAALHTLKRDADLPTVSADQIRRPK